MCFVVAFCRLQPGCNYISCPFNDRLNEGGGGGGCWWWRTGGARNSFCNERDFISWLIYKRNRMKQLLAVACANIY